MELNHWFPRRHLKGQHSSTHLLHIYSEYSFGLSDSEFKIEEKRESFEKFCFQSEVQVIRDDVCIVLNERESLKKQMATELEEQLRRRKFSTCRLLPTEQLVKLLRERLPRMIIIDYILGDIGTALDILPELAKIKGDFAPRVILWTDEPSVNVAVTALKLGAQDYIELGPAHALDKLVQAIEQQLEQDPESQKKEFPLSRFIEPSDLVCQAKNFRSCLIQGKSIINRHLPITVLLGERGTGKNALAQYLHALRCQIPENRAGEYIEIDLDIWADEIEKLAGACETSHLVPLLSNGASVFIDHVECDTGELCNHLQERSKLIWSPEIVFPPFFVIGTSSLMTAQAWVRLFDSEVIEIPPLRERPDDLILLFQRFSIQAEQLKRSNRFKLSNEMLHVIGKWSWPGNIKQFRAVVLEILTNPEEKLALESEDLGEIIEEISENPFDPRFSETLDREAHELGSLDIGNQERMVLNALFLAKLRWQRYHLSEFLYPDIHLARRVLDESFGNYRIAAAKLGTGIFQLRAVLNPRVGVT